MREFSQRENNQSPRTTLLVRITPVFAVSVILAVTTTLVGASSITPYQADLNKNEIVDFPDFAKMANDWGKTGAGEDVPVIVVGLLATPFVHSLCHL